MSHYTYPSAYDPSQPFVEQQQSLHQRQVAYYAPPDLVTASGQAAAPSFVEQHALYDPFSYAEDQQHPATPSEAWEAPPLPTDEAPPLPSEDAPPLPPEPELPHTSATTPAFPSGGQPAPAYPSLNAANPGYVQQPAYQTEAAQPQRQAPQPGWQAYQYPGYEAYQAQQAPWQPQYANQYPAYSQPAPVNQQQPWQAQQQLRWQQPQQQQQQQQQLHDLQVQPQPFPPASQPPESEAMSAPLPAPEAAPRVITDAAAIFQNPGRASRPRRVAIVLRGLPGSGKSFIAKKLKDIEVQQGGDAPRIHAIDDYFVTV